ncbi:hypothetical protein ABZ816_26840 [Actinosynnema sp. NPDC047251]|uniref:Secreted protein n=1 Tax=Saccharothrix espanaensis (strain ATCC 51144 / DSM 44229 / JCM 9112 / NBRC 15066 / NRRL 15764) TaxID=1179773 RepID=K0K327_SACES|nr:hypothetical protein [Saccharothrix espanaensis]CCH31992.1 hypothetical protein BN6_47130 [Saccharothrix espanaensis DSM 44229]
MKSFRSSLAVIAVALTAVATTVALAQTNVGTAQPGVAGDQGVSHLNSQVDLPAGAWVDTPLTVSLPFSGTYELDADVRGRLSGTPSVNTYITARLWNATTNTAVPQSERLVNQIIDHNVGDAATGNNQTAPISEVVHVDGPTTIRLQARRIDAVGAAAIAQIYSDGAGYTSLRFDRVAP